MFVHSSINKSIREGDHKKIKNYWSISR